MNQKYPSMKQLSHDVFHSTIATFCASAIEIGLCYGWANEYIYIRHRHLSDNIPLYILMAIGISHMRKPHFYIIHRLMHPWRVSILVHYCFSCDTIHCGYFWSVMVTIFYLYICFRKHRWRNLVFLISENFSTKMSIAFIIRATTQQHLVELVCMLLRH